MTDHDNKQLGRSVAGVVTLAIVLLLPVVYVLSLGPMCWLAGKGYLSWDSPVFAIYYPLGLLCEHNKVVNDTMESYLYLWQ